MYNELMQLNDDANKDQKKSNSVNHLLIFADNSYSMKGHPFATLQKAMNNLTNMLFDENGQSLAFETIDVIYYNSSKATKMVNNKDEYEAYVKSRVIQGSTDFIQCIDYIIQQVKVLVKENEGLENNFSIIFLTDGQDTCNS